MPKKKGSKKGAKIIDGLATAEMSREQLMGHVKRMQMELDREREERNFFMLEREKLFSLWNLTLEQINIEKDKARLMEVQVADIEQEKEDDMNIFKQKLRYLMLDQAKKLATARLNNLERMKRLQDETQSMNSAMSETLQGTKRQLKTAKRSIHQVIQSMQMEHKIQVSKSSMEYGDEIRRLEAEFGRKFFQWQQDAKTGDRLMSLDLEQREQIEDILELHQDQQEELKGYYNDMMTNNFAIVATLQNDLEESRNNEDKLLMEIKKLTSSLELLKRKNIEEVEEVRVKEEKPKNDNLVREIESLKKMVERKQKYCRMLESINETLMERAMLAEKERNGLQDAFGKVIIEMQKKSSMVKLVSELKIKSLLTDERQRNIPSPMATDVVENNDRIGQILSRSPASNPVRVATQFQTLKPPTGIENLSGEESSTESTRTAVE